MATPNAVRPSIGRMLRLSSAGSFSPASQASSRIAPFSTTTERCRRQTRDRNKKRGVSTLYRSGPKELLSVSSMPLPKPRDFVPKIEVSEKHGLWGFFPEPHKAIYTPTEMEQHGRAWTVEELRKKSWEDLHSLWWVCCRERNMLATSRAFLLKKQLGFGEREIDQRDEVVQKTMRSIKHALTERFYTWEDAVKAAEEDPEINLHGGKGGLYQPNIYDDEPSDWTEPTAPSKQAPQ